MGRGKSNVFMQLTRLLATMKFEGSGNVRETCWFRVQNRVERKMIRHIFTAVDSLYRFRRPVSDCALDMRFDVLASRKAEAEGPKVIA